MVKRTASKSYRSPSLRKSENRRNSGSIARLPDTYFFMQKSLKSDVNSLRLILRKIFVCFHFSVYIFSLGQICLSRPRGCRLVIFCTFHQVQRFLKFPNVSGNSLVSSGNFSEHFRTNFTPPKQFLPFFWLTML